MKGKEQVLLKKVKNSISSRKTSVPLTVSMRLRPIFFVAPGAVSGIPHCDHKILKMH